MRYFKNRDDLRHALADGAPAEHVEAATALVASLEEGFSEVGGWEPDEHGWVVLVEAPADLDDLEALHLAESFLETPKEEVRHFPELGVYTVIVIMNNDFGLGYVLPEAILPPALAAHLADEANHPPYLHPTPAPAH